jgi:FlaG/FlaF family flagellin (archaellin)
LRKITKIKRSIRAISPVISVLLMIAVAVIAALVAYAWVMGYMNFSTSNTGKAIQIQSITTDQTNHLVVYVQNTGQGTVVLDSGYVNDNQVAQTLNIQLVQGATGTVVTNYIVTSTDPLNIKIVTTDGTYATFTGSISSGSIQTYQVTFNLGTGGASMTPSGTQLYTLGTAIAVRATANTGYQFSSWSSTGDITFESSNSATTTAHINGAGTITANFIATQPGQTYPVTFNLGTGGSSINPSGTISYSGGSSIPITTVAASGYQFSSWTSTGSVSFEASTSASTIAHINGAGSITANFVANQPSQNFQVSWILGQGGSSMNPTGAQTYSGGSPVSIFAIPASGYQFSYWLSSTTSGSITFDSVTSASTTAHINGAGSVTAYFVANQPGQNYQVIFSTNGGGSGSSTDPAGTQSYAAGATVPISAIAGSGYQFSSWSTTGSISFDSSTSASTNAHINGAGSIIANFIVSQPGQNYQVTFNLGTGGSSMNPSGSQNYAGGSTVAISAIAASGYQFYSWTSTGSISFDVATSGSTNAHINSEGSITANFIATQPSQNYEVIFGTSGGGTGSSTTPSGTQTYAPGASVQITAIVGSGYQFSSWSQTGSITFDSSTTSPTNAHIGSDGTITAIFTSLPSSSNKLVFASGAPQNLQTNTPSDKITIQRQDQTGTPITTGTTTITLSATPAGTFYSDALCTTPITTTVNINSPSSTYDLYYKCTTAGTQTLTATAANYQTATTTFIVSTTAPTTYSVTYTTNNDAYGTVTPSGTISNYAYGTQVTITAAPKSGYVFSSWTHSGTINIASTTAASTTATILGDGTITANFISGSTDKLVFTGGINQYIELNARSTLPITIQRQTSSGTLITGVTTTVNLASTSGGGRFYLNSGGGPSTTQVTIGSSGIATFYYQDSNTGTPTITASATNFASAQTTFTINIRCTGYEGTNWLYGWTVGSQPPWYRGVGQGVSGTDCAMSDSYNYYYDENGNYHSGTNDGPFTCNSLNTVSANTITISFMYKLVNTDSQSDFAIAYSTDSNPNLNENYTAQLANPSPPAPAYDFHYFAALGTTQNDGQWHTYTITFTKTANPTLFTQYFWVRFDSNLDQHQGSGLQEFAYVDNVIISLT